MNHLHEINAHSQQLPQNLQQEVLDFICFLESRHITTETIENKSGLSMNEIEQACGILQAPHSVSLKEMNEAIKQRGGRL